MLIPLLPWTSILSLILEGHSALAVPLTLIEVTHIDFAILPDLLAHPIHVPIFKLPCVCLAGVSEVVDPSAMEDTVQKASFIVAAILPLVPPLSALLPHDESALVLGLV